MNDNTRYLIYQKQLNELDCGDCKYECKAKDKHDENCIARKIMEASYELDDR